MSFFGNRFLCQWMEVIKSTKSGAFRLQTRMPQAVAIASTGTSAWHTDMDPLKACEVDEAIVCLKDALIWDWDVSSFPAFFSSIISQHPYFALNVKLGR